MRMPGFLRAFTEMMTSGSFGTVTGYDVNRQMPVPIVLTNRSEFDGLDPSRLAPDVLWNSQPHLRTVVSFIAQSVAGLGLHGFKAEGESRERLRGEPLNGWLRRPNAYQTMTEFIEQLVGELALYDVAWVWVYESAQIDGKECMVIPSKWVQVVENAFGVVERIAFQDPYDEAKIVSVDPSQMCRFYSWAAGRASGGASRVDTLRLILAEQHAAWVERHQISKNKGRFGGFFTRPSNAPAWDDEARRTFMRMSRDYQSNTGPRAGENMLLEDGMTYVRASRTPAESQWAESVKLSLVTCAQVFHVNPVMVGVLDNANYSNAKEFRSALYTDTLGPILRKLEERFNAFLLPMLGFDTGEVFVEFNVDSKLRGSFVERASIMSKAGGGPWMTRNELRKLDNLPPLDGADILIVPANVIEGGLASPEDGGDGRPPGEKALMGDVITRWAQRVENSTTAKRKAGVEDWWNEQRWKSELLDDLENAGIEAEHASDIAHKCVEAAHVFFADHTSGFDPTDLLD